jgi:XTP/dITP diphosphohydrolase
MKQIELIFATGNPNKGVEIQAIMPKGITIKTLKDLQCDDDIPETADTLEGNAELKATYVYKKFGVNCFADDTGLEVEALNGMPGVHSARYAGNHRSDKDNIQLLFSELEDKASRKARFRTVIHLNLDNNTYQFEGIVNGHIALEKQGTNGFGYDPVFIPEGETRTFAEMQLSEKNTMSHRARAFQKLVEFVQNQL